jgi:hypothetical protein
MSNCKIGVKAMIDFADHAVEMPLAWNAFGDKGAVALADSRILRSVKRLNLAVTLFFGASRRHDSVVVRWGLVLVAADGVGPPVGDESELFYVYASPFQEVVQRMRAGGWTQVMSHATPRVINGPVIDATNMYWLEHGSAVGTDAIWRASRNGDGSDAAGGSLATFAGYVWWNECDVTCTLRRVAVAGGTPETVGTSLTVLGASGDALYLGTHPTPDQIVAMAADGTTKVVVDHLASLDAPNYVVADRGELFWRTPVTLYRVPATGGSPTAVPGLTFGDTSLAFGLTADTILYDFTRDRYQTAPR